jgi:hypothetical protein
MKLLCGEMRQSSHTLAHVASLMSHSCTVAHTACFLRSIVGAELRRAIDCGLSLPPRFADLLTVV